MSLLFLTPSKLTGFGAALWLCDCPGISSLTCLCASFPSSSLGLFSVALEPFCTVGQHHSVLSSYSAQTFSTLWELFFLRHLFVFVTWMYNRQLFFFGNWFFFSWIYFYVTITLPNMSPSFLTRYVQFLLLVLFPFALVTREMLSLPSLYFPFTIPFWHNWKRDAFETLLIP